MRNILLISNRSPKKMLSKFEQHLQILHLSAGMVKFKLCLPSHNIKLKDVDVVRIYLPDSSSPWTISKILRV